MSNGYASANGTVPAGEWNGPGDGESGPVRRVATGTELADAVRVYLETAPGSGFAGSQVESLDGWDGAENLLWRVALENEPGAALLKLFPDAGLARGRRTYDAHALFADRGIAPRTLWFDRAPERLPEPLLVYGWVEGDPLNLESAGSLQALASVVATVHLSSRDGVARYGTQPLSLGSWLELQRASVQRLLSWLTRVRASSLAAFDQLSRRALAEAARSLPLWDGATLAPVHGDLSPENTLVTPGGDSPILLLDWESYGLGDPSRDVARLLHATSDRTGVLLDTYLPAVEGTQVKLAERVDTWRRLIPFELLNSLLVTLETEPVVLHEAGASEAAMLLGHLHQVAAESLGVELAAGTLPDYRVLFQHTA